MKALFKHLSAISQGKPGAVVNHSSPPKRYIASHAVSTTLLAVLLGTPQLPIIGGGKAMAQTTASCPAGTAPETIQYNPSDSLEDLRQEFNIGGIRTVFTFSEEVPGEVIDQTESRVDSRVYGGIPGPHFRLNIGQGKPPETGSISPGSATVTITFAQPVTLASPLTLLDIDRDGDRDFGRTFQDQVTVTASNSNANVPVELEALGPFTRITGNTASGQIGNSFSGDPDGNVTVTPAGAVDQIRLLYEPGTEFGQPGQDQSIGLAPFTICAPLELGSIGDTVYRDTNGDGIQNNGEEGIGEIELTLTIPGPDGQFGTADDTTETTTTDENGIYGFVDLPGDNYRVTVNNPPEDLNPTQTPPETVVLAAGENLDTVDFGFTPLAQGSIGDTVFNDRDGDGVQDEGESGIDGVQLTLRDSEGNTVDTTTTNENGNYTFDNVPLGTYTVESARPTDFSPTTETVLSAELTEANPNRDDIDFGFRVGAVGASGPINLRLVKRITNILRGNQPISGIAFNQFEEDPNDEDDNILNSSPQSSPVGITGSETPVQSGDVVEYTIYFLSEGGEALENVKFCDLIPDNTTFVDGSIVINGAGNGADNGTFLSPLSLVPADFQNICSNGTPTNGAVISNLGTLPAGGQFGFVRFRVRVN